MVAFLTLWLMGPAGPFLGYADMTIREVPCSGNIETCQRWSGECGICAERDCPHGDTAHYFHDGCPSCGGAYDEMAKEMREDGTENK